MSTHSQLDARFFSDEPMGTVEALDFIEDILEGIDGGSINPVDGLYRMHSVIEYWERNPDEDE